jgi:hypothetical protein
MVVLPVVVVAVAVVATCVQSVWSPIALQAKEALRFSVEKARVGTAFIKPARG